MSAYVTLRYPISAHVTLRYPISAYVTLRYPISVYVTLRYPISAYVTLALFSGCTKLDRSRGLGVGGAAVGVGEGAQVPQIVETTSEIFRL